MNVDNIFWDLPTSYFPFLIGNREGFPFYNIKERINARGSLQIEVALAGYAKEDLEVFVQPIKGNNYLIIKTSDNFRKKLREEEDRIMTKTREWYYHTQRIKYTEFSLRFDIGKYTKVLGVSMKDGILTIDLKYTEPAESDRQSFTIE